MSRSRRSSNRERSGWSSRHGSPLARASSPRRSTSSPKCFGCSLNGVCLPDETLALKRVPADPVAPKVRRLYPAHDDALPLYVQEQGAKVGKSGENLVIRKGTDTLAKARLKDVSQLVLCGNVGVSAQTIHLLAESSVPLVHLRAGTGSTQSRMAFRFGMPTTERRSSPSPRSRGVASDS